MTRYEECRKHLQSYVDQLRASPGLNPSAVEGLVRAHVQQPAYDVTFRETLVADVLGVSDAR